MTEVRRDGDPDQPVEFEMPSEPKSKKPKKKVKPWVWIVVLVALVAIGFGAWEYTSTPGFCRSCHEISVSVVGFEESAHADVAGCMDCHADEGFVGEAVAHIGGIQEAYVHFTESPAEGEIRGFVPAERCLKCHEKDWDELPETHPTRDSLCGVCHRDTAHTNPKPLYVPEAAEVK